MNNLDYGQRQTLALAGVFQVAQLVNDLATRGLVDQQTFATSIGSVLVTDPETTADIYGGELPNLRAGANTLRKVLLKDSSVNPSVLRYAMAILILNTKLAKNPQMLTAIGQRLDAVKSQAMHFNPTHENVLAALAGLYQDTLSTLSFVFRYRVTLLFCNKPAMPTNFVP